MQKSKGKQILGMMLALVCLIGCLVIPDVQAKAEDMIIALSSKDVKIGDKLTVTVTLPAGVTGTVNLTYSKDIFTYQSASAETSVNAGTVVMTLGSYGANSSRASGTVTFQAEAAGSASFSASAPSAGNQEGDRVSVGGAGVAVTVANASADAEKSSDNTLASLTLSDGTLSPAFSGSVTEYQAEVSNDVTSIAVSAKPNDAKASVVSVTGSEKLSVGANSVQVTVQAENGVKKTYTITVTRKEAAQETKDTQKETQTQQESEKDTDTGDAYFTIDGTKLYLTDAIPDRYITTGFEKTKVTLWDKEYPCLVRTGTDTPIRILYLVDENGQNGALYLLDLDAPTEIYPYVCMNYTQYLHTINAENGETEAATQDASELFSNADSQTKLLFFAFVVVVVILLIIIIVLMIKRRHGGDDDDDDFDDYYDDDDEEDEDDDLYGDIEETSGPSKRYGEETFRRKGGFLHKILEGIDDDDDLDDLDDELDDDDPEKEEPDEADRKEHFHLPEEKKPHVPTASETITQPQREQPDEDKIRQKTAFPEDEDLQLQDELAKEVRSSLLGRKKKQNPKDIQDDIEFIDL